LTPGRVSGKKTGEEDMKKIPCLALILITLAGLVSPAFGDHETGTPLIIDVRTEGEWNNGHLKGAVLIPYNQIGEKIGALVRDKSQKIYLYCRTGRRAQVAKETLNKLGYQDVVNLGSLEDAARILKIEIVR